MTRPRTPPPAALDSGLLSPVRAGTAAERAVDDDAWLTAMLDTEAALARAQARLGTVPVRAAEAITRLARPENLDLRDVALSARETANPVVGLVAALTAAVARKDPEAAGYVHLGSTSQDILDTAAMLVSARTLRGVRDDLRRAAGALAALARRHRDTPMAGRTLALHAVPTTFGLRAAGWRELLLDAEVRVGRLLDGGLPVSLGGAAGTLAAYLEYAGPDAGEDYAARLVSAFAAETGLSRPALPWHALRTPVADLGAVLSFTAGALGKIAVDVQGMARTEVGEVAEPGGEGRGASSAMPQKRNPVLSVLLRSAALQVPALAGALAQCLVSEDERSAGAWHAEWLLLRECLRLTGGAAETAVALAEGLTADPDRMRGNLGLTGSQVVTERLTAALAPRVGRVAAKKLLARACVEADRDGRPLAEVLAGTEALREHLPHLDLDRLLDPERYTGAAAPLVDGALTAHHPTA
jgi:3-carboxy-cis,cis-muconate cycloisomerase